MRLLLAANWKMHLYPQEAQRLTLQLKAEWLNSSLCQLPTVLFPPLLYLREVLQLVEGSSLQVGAQNGYPGEFGAFTGEVSTAQIAACGAQWLLVGHSERRLYFQETSDFLQQKIQAAQQRGLSVIYCVGETLEERKQGKTLLVLKRQIEEVMQGIPILWEKLALAYEPVWAIGTGINATPAQAQEAHSYLRTILQDLGAPVEKIPILYGGSLKPENAPDIFAQPDVDGGLVGGASLKAESFISIAQALHSKTLPE
ncbi:MAG: triose-phosphate isomerase [Bacteroidia bacterium]|nr:triose-phosphate isomerase [Bacteroidia bacterium]MDW8134252.1 triose-phosphate isomerase [Bacteroidia bacterium]